MHLLRSVPGDGLVWPGLVVFESVLLGVLGQHHGVVDLVDEQPLYLSVWNPRSSDPFRPEVRIRVAANSTRPGH